MALPLSKPDTAWLITGIRRLYSSDRRSISSAIVGMSFRSPPEVPELVRNSRMGLPERMGDVSPLAMRTTSGRMSS
uniref:Uncharacterized protein n=1 Tax=Arundo donax TaxID=35708 RepID=A0A0A9B5H7_ARUDO